MNKLVVFLCMALAAISVRLSAQSSGTSRTMSFTIVKQYPLLEIMDGSLSFMDSNGNGVIDADERGVISFKVMNRGKGDAYGCTVSVTPEGDSYGISVQTPQVGTIRSGAMADVKIPVSSSHLTVNGQVTFMVKVDEPTGFGSDPLEIAVETRQFNAPRVQVTDFAVNGGSAASVAKKENFDLQFYVQNTDRGAASDVVVNLVIPDNVMLVGGDMVHYVGNLGAGQSRLLEYSLIANDKYVGNMIPVQINLREHYGKYAENRTINIEVSDRPSGKRIEVAPRRVGVRQPEPDMEIASLVSDVDRDIPVSDRKSPNTFAVIIANESYDRVAAVPMAANDGKVFAEYCEKTLGLPRSNVRTYINASYGNMVSAITDIKSIAQAYDGDIDVLFYYAGHGVPDESSRSAYLLPVDADGRNLAACYPVEKLYRELGSMGVRRVTLFLDACFSGSTRGNGMLASARGVAVKAKPAQPTGNMVIISAAQGDETAYPYTAKKHGMFTYFLLKKLKETKGEAPLSEIYDYVNQEVKRKSIVENGKTQTPTVSPSPSVADTWEKWKLK